MTDPIAAPGDVVAFWLNAGPEAWYERNAAFDARIRDAFAATWRAARDGKLDLWFSAAERVLAFVILTDQFPRNMFRDDPRAFATDRLAKRAACHALGHGWDRKIAEPERQFLYLPFMHSERLTDQDHCVRLMAERMEGGDNLLHARAHREIIRRFNRFPYRNRALGRASTAAEARFLSEGGYAAVLDRLAAADAPGGRAGLRRGVI